MELLRPKTTNGKWVVEMSDLTIRVKEWEKNNLMGDYRGCIIADLKPSLGITEQDVENGCLNEDNYYSYLKGTGGRQHAFEEVIANANSICDIMNNVRGHDVEMGAKVNRGIVANDAVFGYWPFKRCELSNDKNTTMI